MEMIRWTEEARRQEKFEDITKLIEKSPHIKIKRREFNYPECILEFEDPKIATLFAIGLEDNYFPMDNELIPICYDYSYVCGLHSLNEYANHLKDRRVMYLVDNEWVRTRPNAQIPRDLTEQQTRLTKESYARQITTKTAECGRKREEIIVCYTSGWGDEYLYGALGGFSLREQGYIIFPEEARLLNWLVGFTGDLIAVKLGAFQDKLIEEGIIEYGAWLPELELQKIFGKCTKKSKIEVEEAVAVEIESSKESASSGRGQLTGYVKGGHFNHGILVCPGRAELDEKPIEKMGLVTWNDKKEEVYIPPEKLSHQPEKLAELLTISKRVASLILVKNTTLEGLSQTYGNKSIFETIGAFTKSPKFID